MISDFIKGKKKFDYPDAIQHGIMLHRAIDTFTDTHEATFKAKQVFRPAYRLYSGALVDMVYDHFLATDEAVFPGNSLFDFSQEVYKILDEYGNILPDKCVQYFEYMKTKNWLYNYRSVVGIEKGIKGVVSRAAYLSDSDTACKLFETHYQLLQDCYRHFWNDVLIFAKTEFDAIPGVSGSDSIEK